MPTEEKEVCKWTVVYRGKTLDGSGILVYKDYLSASSVKEAYRLATKGLSKTAPPEQLMCVRSKHILNPCQPGDLFPLVYLRLAPDVYIKRTFSFVPNVLNLLVYESVQIFGGRIPDEFMVIVEEFPDKGHCDEELREEIIWVVQRFMSHVPNVDCYIVFSPWDKVYVESPDKAYEVVEIPFLSPIPQPE